MRMTYIECMTNVEIADELYYSVGFIDNVRWIALKELDKILCCE